MPYLLCSYSLFFFNDTATTEIYTLSLHDALPISRGLDLLVEGLQQFAPSRPRLGVERARLIHTGLVLRPDRKSTRLNSSHLVISYAVFCLKKKKRINMVSTQ